MSMYRIELGTSCNNTKQTRFPCGEFHVELIGRFGQSDKVVIQIPHPYPNIFDLGILVEALRAYKFKKIFLDLRYVPYGRQDRRSATGTAFSLAVFCSFINSLNFDGVIVIDPHSYVTPALLNNCIVFSQVELLKAAYGTNTIAKEMLGRLTCVVAPDAGGEKRAAEVASYLEVPLVHAGKSRNPATGEISKFWFKDDGQDLSRPLIVDDICDGGGTFRGLAEIFPESSRMSLLVSHASLTNLRIFDHFWRISTLNLLFNSRDISEQRTLKTLAGYEKFNHINSSYTNHYLFNRLESR